MLQFLNGAYFLVAQYLTAVRLPQGQWTGRQPSRWHHWLCREPLALLIVARYPPYQMN